MLPTILSIAIAMASPIAFNAEGSATVVLASRSMSLDDRYGNSFVNDVFKDNILLTMQYMDGKVTAKNDVDWSTINDPFTYEFTLKPGEVFAFHDQVLPSYSKSVVKTTNAHFNYAEGFKTDGYLMGDGVCHLASLFNWAAQTAGLSTLAPTNHNFAVIPDISKEYGVGIFVDPYAKEGASSNLYITNNKDKPVTFKFEYKNDVLGVTILEAK